MKRPWIVVCVVLLLACQGCSGIATYGQDRLRDFSDVVDVRYGTGFGLGASLQLLPPFETGLGCSVEWYYRRWFGRKSVEVRDGLYAHGIIVGFDGDYLRRLGNDDWFCLGNSSTGSFDILIFNVNHGRNRSLTGTEAWFNQPAGDPPILTEVRIGGVVFLPGVNGGLHLNVGEVIDFVCGIVGYDLMNDDGIPKFRRFPEPRASIDDKTPGGPQPLPPAGGAAL